VPRQKVKPLRKQLIKKEKKSGSVSYSDGDDEDDDDEEEEGEGDGEGESVGTIYNEMDSHNLRFLAYRCFICFESTVEYPTRLMLYRHIREAHVTTTHAGTRVSYINLSLGGGYVMQYCDIYHCEVVTLCNIGTFISYRRLPNK